MLLCQVDPSKQADGQAVHCHCNVIGPTFHEDSCAVPDLHGFTGMPCIEKISLVPVLIQLPWYVGPKTLCNACGVKRVRAMRLASGEPAPAKRRSSGDRPIPHTLPPKTVAALSLGKQSSGSLTSDSAAIGRKRARSPSASGRPQRKVRRLPKLSLWSILQQ